MNGPIGIDYGRVDELLDKLNTTQTTLTDILGEISSTVVSRLRTDYKGAAGDTVANKLTEASQKATEAVNEIMSNINTRMTQDRTEQEATEKAQQAQAESFI